MMNRRTFLKQTGAFSAALLLPACLNKVKEKKKNHVPMKEFEGRNIALNFEKTSTRTRCSFEVAAHDLGMGVTYLDPSGSQIGKKKTIAVTAR